VTRPTLARTAITLISLFPLLVLILHGVQAGHYHPLSQAVSELALGRDGWVMAIAFCSLGTGTLFLAAMLRRLDTTPRTAPCLIAASGLLSYVSAVVHADGPHGSTTHGQIHQTVGIVTFILMIAGMFALVRPFRRDHLFCGFCRGLINPGSGVIPEHRPRRATCSSRGHCLVRSSTARSAFGPG
jgi:hypothetical protein